MALSLERLLVAGAAPTDLDVDLQPWTYDLCTQRYAPARPGEENAAASGRRRAVRCLINFRSAQSCVRWFDALKALLEREQSENRSGRRLDLLTTTRTDECEAYIAFVALQRPDATDLWLDEVMNY